MTAIATILALLPMALGLSKAGVFIAGPLAIVVIGGLTTSTILTLLLVPTLYVIVEEQAEPAKQAHLFAPEQTESAPNRNRALLGLTLALIAQEAQVPEADPQILATLSSAATGRYPQTWSEEQVGRAVARDPLEPLSIKLLASSTGNGRGHAHENSQGNV